jgi:hypothetical protein
MTFRISDAGEPQLPALSAWRSFAFPCPGPESR